MKGTIKVLNAAGHGVVEYDTEDATSLKEAQQVLDNAVRRRMQVFNVTDGINVQVERASMTEGVTIGKDPSISDYMVLAPLAGG